MKAAIVLVAGLAAVALVPLSLFALILASHIQAVTP